MRDGPARRAADEAHLALIGEAVELVDDAVDVERQLVALLADARVVFEAAVGAFRGVDQGADRQAPLPECGQHLGVRRRQRAALDDAERIGVERERTFRRFRRILHAHAAGGAVARIDEHLAALLARVRVVFFERGTRHVDLAAHLDDARPVLAVQAQRNRLDRAQVRRDVLAGRAVAARRAAHEAAILVAQANRKPVELGLDRKHRIRAVQPLLDAPHEVVHFLVGERVRERQHRNLVRHLGERAFRRGADALRRRIRRRELRMRRFDVLQLAHQLVVLDIGDVGFVEHVIAVVRIVDAAAQCLGARGRVVRVGFFRSHRGFGSPAFRLVREV